MSLRRTRSFFERCVFASNQYCGVIAILPRHVDGFYRLNEMRLFAFSFVLGTLALHHEAVLPEWREVVSAIAFFLRARHFPGLCSLGGGRQPVGARSFSRARCDRGLCGVWL